MSRLFRHRWTWIAAGGLALLAAAALGRAAYLEHHLAPLPALEHLRIAVVRTPHTALLRIAAARGFFTEEGLRVTLVPVEHGPEGIGLALQGKADLAGAADVPFTIAVMNGHPLAALASVVSVSTDHAIVGRRDRGIAAPRDLAGRRIGATFGTSGEYFLWAFLTRHKLAPASVTLVNLAPGRMSQALAEGAVDAVSTWQPVVHQVLAAQGENAAAMTEADAYTVNVFLLGRGSFLKANPAAMQKLLRALLKAERFAAAQPLVALQLASKQLQIDAAVLEPIWKDFDFRIDLLQSQLITLEEQARWAMARGHAAPGPVPNFIPQLHLDALLAVQPSRVTVLR